jgi:hypothetical protein
MSITRFRPEIWSAALLVALRKKLVYAGPGVVNRDYEGDIQAAGDTVRITSISDPTIGTYSANTTTVTPEELTDAQRTLVVDQAKYFAFFVDDVDARQAKGNVIPEAMRRAAYKLADVVDQYVAALYTQIQTANVLNSGSAITLTAVDTSTHEDLWNKVIVPLKVKLDEANLPTEGRYLVIPPWAHGYLLQSVLFTRVDASGTSEGLRNGMVGRAGGFDILVSNNCPVPSGSDYIFMAGTDMAISFAEQINKTEAYRPEAKFADAVKGLMLYGAKMVRPEGAAYAKVTRATGI